MSSIYFSMRMRGSELCYGYVITLTDSSVAHPFAGLVSARTVIYLLFLLLVQLSMRVWILVVCTKR